MLAFRLVPLGLLSSVRLAALFCALAAAVGIPPSSLAHEGHDHDDAARAALASSTYPRVVAQSELYEIAGILRGDRLSIYLDRFGTNEPVTDAKVTVTIGAAEPIEAEAAENGVYTVPFPRLVQPGRSRSSSTSPHQVAMIFWSARSRCRRRRIRAASPRSRPHRPGSPPCPRQSAIRSCWPRLHSLWASCSANFSAAVVPHLPWRRPRLRPVFCSSWSPSR